MSHSEDDVRLDRFTYGFPFTVESEMRGARRFQQLIEQGDEAAVQTLEGAVRTLGGPGSGWHAEDGHVPGSQGGKGGGAAGTALHRAREARSGVGSHETVHDSEEELQEAHERAVAQLERAGFKQERGENYLKGTAATLSHKTRTDVATIYHGTSRGRHQLQVNIVGAPKFQRMRDFGDTRTREARGYSRRRLEEFRAAAGKLPQSVVLYMSPAQNEKDFVCGGCTFATPEAECALFTEPSDIDLEVGSCGLYVPGTPHDQDMLRAVPAKMAGYVEEGPYTCGRCSHFLPPSACEGVAGKIDADGCCNAWEAAEEPRTAGGPGSGWHAEAGHVPGSQGGKGGEPDYRSYLEKAVDKASHAATLSKKAVTAPSRDSLGAAATAHDAAAGFYQSAARHETDPDNAADFTRKAKFHTDQRKRLDEMAKKYKK